MELGAAFRSCRQRVRAKPVGILCMHSDYFKDGLHFDDARQLFRRGVALRATPMAFCGALRRWHFSLMRRFY